MKSFFAFSILLFGFQLLIFGQDNNNSTKTQFINLNCKQDLDTFALNFCDTFSIEITGLYPIVETLPQVQFENTFASVLLINDGFKHVNGGYGNWDKGPRFTCEEFKKDSCNCKVIKKYYFYQKMDNGLYNLRVSERIICNSNIYMDK